ncbi:universal stress protein [Streptomyces sp. TRM66268-LWL]|uniref:Universal stress protein n=1 Tax=Streptomyces polyasparticus TaxID=2767826 RepID=A0ABR7SL54_9ACTN|nr:universal stress protein [Streptomyces polyasparticus]MBC9716044.1 universal stress protein [Streptomyces polyasparticus]
MSRNITVGFDGSPESRAASEWAAREAKLRDLPLRLVHVCEPVPALVALSPFLGAGTHAERSERIAREAAEGLRLGHPDVHVDADQMRGLPVDALAEAAEEAELLVLGSRGLSGIAGFLVGSVSTAVISRIDVPVVLVRAGEHSEGEHGDTAGISTTAPGHLPVVLGLDTGHPDEKVISFAFEEAARRGTRLTVVHGWSLPPYFAYGLPVDLELNAELGRQDAAELAAVLSPWREKYPDVEVVEESRPGSPADQIVDAARDASLVVVGRKVRRSRIGFQAGPVTYAVLHHATPPVAVVAHD